MQTRSGYRLPAEWERQSATLLAWPSRHGDWSDRIDAIRREVCALIEAIAQQQSVVVLVQPGEIGSLEPATHRHPVHRIEAPFDDTWCRDFGPVTLVHSGSRLALDFYFNGWGGKYPAALDNRVNTLLARHALFNRLEFRQFLFELEGGAIDCDGHGRLLVNWHCLRTRQAHLSRLEIEGELKDLLNISEILGIDIAGLPGDDTDGHIDTLVRFVDRNTLAFQQQSDRVRQANLVEQLQSLRCPDGQAYRLIELPLPADVNPDLPASYANFLFINQACLVPAFCDAADHEAQRRLQHALPGHRVRPVPAAVMIEQYGGPHCATMHIPAALA